MGGRVGVYSFRPNFDDFKALLFWVFLRQFFSSLRAYDDYSAGLVGVYGNFNFFVQNIYFSLI